MAAHAKPAPDNAQSPDNSERDLSLLKNPDGSWMDDVAPEVAAEFLQKSPQQIRCLVHKKRLSSKGFRQTRRILVSSLRAFEPDTHEKRSARAKITIGKVTPAEHLARGQKAGKTRMERFTPEQRSAFPRARLGKSTHEQRSANQRKIYTQLAPEHLSAFRGTPEERHARAKKASATLGPEGRHARAKKGAPAREAKKTLEQRFRLKAEMEKRTFEEKSDIAMKAAKTRKANHPPEQLSAWGRNAAAAVSPEKKSENAQRLRDYHAKVKADREELRRLKAAQNGAASGASEQAAARTKRGPPFDEKAADYYAAWVAAGSPRDMESKVRIAKPYYPRRADRSPEALRKKLERQGAKMTPRTQIKKTLSLES